jgi:hypothetical protein
VLRVPFFLEPGYPKSEDFEESNHDRLVRKWGGKAEFEAQKQVRSCASYVHPVCVWARMCAYVRVWRCQCILHRARMEMPVHPTSCAYGDASSSYIAHSMLSPYALTGADVRAHNKTQTHTHTHTILSLSLSLTQTHTHTHNSTHSGTG